MSSPQRILLLSNKGTLAQSLSQALTTAGHDVAAHEGLDELGRWLHEHSAQMAVLPVRLDTEDNCAESDGLVARLMEECTQHGAHMLVIAQLTHGATHLQHLFRRRMTNFLGISKDGDVDSSDLFVTIGKISSNEIFGIDHYLAPDFTQTVFTISDSRTKDAVIDEVEAFALGAVHPLVAAAVGTAADELISNAIYNAPVDRFGNHRYARLPRTQQVVLGPGEELTLRCAFDGRKLCLSASDPFGSLKPEQVLDNLARCFAMGRDQVAVGSGGAGIGLYTVFNLMHHMVINVDPGKRTEIIAIIDVTQSYKAYTSRAKSFNVFVGTGPGK